MYHQILSLNRLLSVSFSLKGSIIMISGLFHGHSADLCVKYDSFRDLCLVTKAEGSTLWDHHPYRYRLFPNGEDETLLENKAREITQTYPPTYLS